jgi:hypothetical protein
VWLMSGIALMPFLTKGHRPETSEPFLNDDASRA